MRFQYLGLSTVIPSLFLPIKVLKCYKNVGSLYTYKLGYCRVG